VSLEQLRRRLYLLSFIDEFGPIYAVYTLWFNDNGVTVAQLSAVFLTWSIVTIALEIPSGAVADRIDRRYVLAGSFAIRAVGIAVWLIVPSFVGALIGAALFAVNTSLASGAWEAHIHDQLTHLGASERYPVVMARVMQLGHLGVALASVVAIGVLAIDGTFLQLGWATVAIHALPIRLVLQLPDVSHISATEPGDESPLRRWWTTLGEGIREARASADVMRLTLLGAMVEGLFIFDEYTPLLARDRGASDATVPVLVLVVWSGLLIGGEVVARRPAASGSLIGGGLVLASFVVAFGLVSSPLWSLALIGVAYAALQANWVVIDARLQERVGPSHRATVTSMKGFGGGLISGLAFIGIGFATTPGGDSRPGLYVALAVLGLIGVLAFAWIPPRRPAVTSASEDRS